MLNGKDGFSFFFFVFVILMVSAQISVFVKQSRTFPEACRDNFKRMSAVPPRLYVCFKVVHLKTIINQKESFRSVSEIISIHEKTVG